MRIDVLLGDALPASVDVAGKMVVVIDVLRAATTVATALANGARAVIPFDSVDEPVVFAKQYERAEIRLAGERRMQRIPGFDLGNSPLEHTEPNVRRRTILIERRYQAGMHRLRSEATHACALADGGFEADVDACFALDTQPLVVGYQERQLRQYKTVTTSARLVSVSIT